MHSSSRPRRLRLAFTLLGALSLALGLMGAASARPQAQPRYGGTVVVGLGSGEPDTLDPTVSRNAAALEIFQSMCQRLYELDSKLQPVPVLAAALPVLSKDKLSYTVQLRQGLQFNDGTPFNAQAVVGSVQRFISYPGSSKASDFASVAGVSASGPFTVVYRLKARDSTFTGNAYVLSPTQLARLGGDFGSDPVCVGPFMFDHRVIGDNVTVIKSPYYYDQKDVYLDKIVYKPLPDVPTATAALKAGDIQALDQVSTTELAGVRQMPTLGVLQAYQLGWGGLLVNIGNRSGLGNLPYANAGTPLASSPKLRQAFEEALDRDAFARVVYGGLVQPSCTPIAPADTPWFDSTNVPCTPYDPKDAKTLVAASGFSKPTVHLLTRNLTDNLRAAQFIQAQEAAVGINVVIDLTDSAGAIALRTAGNFDTYLGGFSPGGVDPNFNTFRSFATSADANYSGYSNPRLDLIFANGLKATSFQARSTLYRVAQQIILHDRPIIVLFNPATFAAFDTSLTGVQLTASGTLSVANARYKG
jgi:peptide/nickel transport system substrate-binding protein